MRRVKVWATSTVVLGLVLGGMVVAPASAVPDGSGAAVAPAVVEGGAGGVAARSGSSYALVIAKAARKALIRVDGFAPPITAMRGARVYAPSKDARWFAGMSATSRRISWSESENDGSRTEKMVTSAMRKELARRGFTRVYSRSAARLSIYRNRSYVCQVEGPAVACVTRAAAAKALVKPASLWKGLPAKLRKGRVALENISITAGATRGYKVARFGVGAPGDWDAGYALQYKAPGRGWTTVFHGQDVLPCAAAEKTKHSRRALAGTYCYRSSGDSTVRR